MTEPCSHYYACRSASLTSTTFAHAQMWCNRTGQVVRVPGLPPMHDYEYFPQVVSKRTVHLSGGWDIDQYSHQQESRPHPTEPECLSVAYE